MTGITTGAYRGADGRMVASCWCGWWPTEPVLVALRAHQDETGHDTEGEQ